MLELLENMKRFSKKLKTYELEQWVSYNEKIKVSKKKKSYISLKLAETFYTVSSIQGNMSLFS